MSARVRRGRPLVFDLSGQSFSRLTVVARGLGEHWECLCSCGTSCLVASHALRNGRTQSCGCLRKELASFHRTTHGMAKTPEYEAWAQMKERCSDPGKNHKWYGSRGITVCDRWIDSFENFIADMGSRPSPKHSVDRYPDNDGNYEPSNCRWATPAEQSGNRRNVTIVTVAGERMALKRAANKLGLKYTTVVKRVRRGATAEQALGLEEKSV